MAKANLSKSFESPKTVGLATQIKDLFLQVQSIEENLNAKKELLREACLADWKESILAGIFLNNYKIETPTGIIQTEIKISSGALSPEQEEAVKDLPDFVKKTLLTDTESVEIIDLDEILASVLSRELPPDLISVSLSQAAIQWLSSNSPESLSFKKGLKVAPKVIEKLSVLPPLKDTEYPAVLSLLEDNASSSVVCGNKGVAK